MSKNIKQMGIIVLVASLAAAGAGGAVWWKLGAGRQGGDAKAAKVELKPGPDYKYVSLDKVLVMLRGRESVTHYMAVDIVFKVLPEQERRAKEHLPLLRTVAVKALAGYSLEAAQALSVSQVAEVLNKAFRASYAAEQHEAPFAEALIGKLIIE